MFKKAKLFSLLAIIVASTIVGLFGLSGTANAQESDVIWEFDSDLALSYGDYDGDGEKDIYQRLDAVYNDNERKSMLGAMGICVNDPETPDDDDEAEACVTNNSTRVFIFQTTNNETGTQENHFIVFEEDPATAKTAKYVVYGPIENLNLITGERTLGENDNPDNPTPENPTEVTTDPPPGTGSSGEPVPQTCQIKGIGWLLCPIVNFLAAITDQSYDLLNKYLLKLEPIALPGSNQSTEKMQLYDSWRMMRDFANIIFIIGFLLIVFSQITSIGITNYGVKRLLPKIIIAAILVNISYFICAVAVDLSNILGNSLRDLLMPGSGGLPEFNFMQDQQKHEATGFVGISDLILGAGLSAAVVYVFLPVFLPLVISAALAVITAVIVLTLRQALVVILIVISPLAFVALLLPNTENYFQKWRTVFTSMLLIYPAISVVFGASALASSILMNATDDFWTQMIGAGVSVIPLFITPILMKVSGGLLNRWVGIVNDPTKGPIDGMRNSLRERGQIIKGGRAERYGDFTNNPISTSGVGGKVFGGEGSLRRRVLTWGTAYGQESRTRARKDRLSELESDMERTYLDGEKGQQARNSSTNAKERLNITQLNVETMRLQSPEGMEVERQKENAEMRKQTAATQAQTAAIGAIPSALAAQSQESEIRKKATEDSLSARATPLVAPSARTAAETAELRKKTAENQAQTATTKHSAGSVADRAQRKSELELQAAKTGSDADWAGQTIENPTLRDLTQEVQKNQAATGVAQGVTGRRFNKAVADGAVDIPGALGVAPTSPAYGEVEKAADAARTEAGEKEVRREKQALREHIAKQVANGIDPDTTLRDREITASDDYERSAVFDEMAARGRDGVIDEMRTKYALGSDERTMLEEAIQNNASALVGKAPDQIKGPNAAFDNIKGEVLAGLSTYAAGRSIKHLSMYKNNAIMGGPGSAQEQKYNDMLAAYKSAVRDIQNSSDLQGRFGSDVGNKIIELTDSGGAADNIQADLADLRLVLSTYKGKIR